MSLKKSDNETAMNTTSKPSSREAIKKSVMNIEFHDWQQSNFVTRQRIKLKRSQINPDATTTLEFNIGETQQTFRYYLKMKLLICKLCIYFATLLY